MPYSANSVLKVPLFSRPDQISMVLMITASGFGLSYVQGRGLHDCTMACGSGFRV